MVVCFLFGGSFLSFGRLQNRTFKYWIQYMTYSHLFPQLKRKIGSLRWWSWPFDIFNGDLWNVRLNYASTKSCQVWVCPWSFIVLLSRSFPSSFPGFFLQSSWMKRDSRHWWPWISFLWCKCTVIQWNHIHPIWVKSISVDGNKYLCTLARWGENILYLFVFFGAINPVEHILYGCIQSRETWCSFWGAAESPGSHFWCDL